MRIGDFEDFIDFPLPSVPPEGVVYVLFAVLNGKRIPIYVGQTERFLLRMEDYDYAHFGALTDFKVGEALKYLKAKYGCKIEVSKKASQNRLDAERLLIESLRPNFKLLNKLRGIWDTARPRDEAKEEALNRIRDFCDRLVKEELAKSTAEGRG